MVYKGVAGNTCTGKDRSPQLTWTHAPAGTQSFVVLMFDQTASFTHWGMYHIPPTTTKLPENAGVVGDKYGLQVINDFFAAAKYDGPCPPPGLVHHYVITVYALDCDPSLPSPPGFPPVGETLLYALLEGRTHILDTASITGFYST
jgi:Raf kinase inhibitor-like YbhB/YbcL family protein